MSPSVECMNPGARPLPALAAEDVVIAPGSGRPSGCDGGCGLDGCTKFDRADRIHQAVLAHERGWLLTPLRGKRPIMDQWQKAGRPTLQQVTKWARRGNLGLRTGSVSRVIVIDVDTPKGGCVNQLDLPVTVTVMTGSGGLHLYFCHPGGRVRNSVGRLALHVDVRGDGGQVVFPGSIHPDTGRQYRWAEGLSPDEVPVADLPDEVLRLLVRPHPGNSAYCADIAERFRNSNRTPGGFTPYGHAALASEVEAVRSACQGSRNHTLNRAAFSLGQLIAGGHLIELDVVSQLVCAAEGCGLPEDEAARTIRSGLSAGMREPRS